MQQQDLLFHRNKGISLEGTKDGTSPQEHPPPSAAVFIRRIGRTNYRVKVHLSQTSSETLDDKIFRLIRNEAVCRKAVGM